MEYYAGIDVSLEDSSVCVVDATVSTTDGSMTPATRYSLEGLDARRPITEALLWHLYGYGEFSYQAGIQRSMCCVPICRGWRRSRTVA
jgi:hypothetical protein